MRISGSGEHFRWSSHHQLREKAIRAHEPNAFPAEPVHAARIENLGRRTYVTHAEAFEPMPPGDLFGDLINAPRKYVVSRTPEKPIWRGTTIIRDNVVEAVRALKTQPGGSIVTDGSSQLVRTLLAHDLVDELHLLLYPVTLGRGKRIWANDVHTRFTLRSATPYPTGVVGLDYVRQR